MRYLMEQYPMPIFATISIFIFLSLFAAILFWVFKLESKDSFQRKAMLALDDEDQSSSGAQL